jgi:Na+-driven multidrug efflux pump
MVFFSMSSIFFQAVSGTGNTFIALIIEAICIAMYLVYAFLATEKDAHLPLWTIWMAEVLYMFSFGILSAIYLHSDRWKQLRI